MNTGQFNFALSDGVVTPSANSSLTTHTALVDNVTKALIVTIGNAYPGAVATVSETITNSSTIPAKLTLNNTSFPPQLAISEIKVNNLAYTDAMPIPTGDVTVSYKLTVPDLAGITIDKLTPYTGSTIFTFDQNTN